ncbi:MAG: response regulator [Planctomycetaceae bacterium]|nr:response regulator [Planctomycetales bacterium]MCB9875708.1 response regulator [Planctomycetaceae bacterium]
MALVLIVDDSALERKLAASLLAKGNRFEVCLAEDGKQALRMMERRLPDIVVADLVMPNVNGLELVTYIQERFARVPVILMTAHGSEDIAVAALENGASSYVPKSRLAERLLETVDRVLARSRAERNRERLIQCVGKLDATFYLENDVSLVPPLVDYLQATISAIGIGSEAERLRVGIALEEAIYNAMLHGNLEMPDDFASVMRGGRFAELEYRRGQPPFNQRKVVVDVHLTTYTARFVVRDQGAGFRPSKRSVSERFEQGSHRGTALMRAFMDEVRYNELGNEVTLIKLHDRAVRSINEPVD